MARRVSRPIYFVCAAVDNQHNLITKMYAVTSQQEAIDLFEQQFLIQPQEILGPFYKKRTQILENTRVLKFSNQIKKGLFNGWIVNAFLLQEPIDHAFLVFIKREDGKKMSPPKGTITVPISDLRFI